METTNTSNDMTPRPTGEQTRGTDSSPGQPSESRPTKADVFVETGLLPEAYLVAIVETEGGRMKQQEICDVTDWSDPTVSRILLELEDADRIHRVRIGRGKVVCLPGQMDESLDLTDGDEEGR